MQSDLQTQVAFYLTGRRSGEHLHAAEGLDLRPALFAGYRDLTALRYDFPLLLQAQGEAYVQSLSGLMDKIVDACVRGSGSDGERIRKHLLQLERKIRSLIAGGARGSLIALWDMAALDLVSGAGELLKDSLSRARAMLKADAEVVDCDAAMPARLLRHAWRRQQEKKARRFRHNIDRLTIELENILRVDFLRSRAGCSARALELSVGSSYDDAFDFEAMSKMLAKARPEVSLPESRRRRIEWLLSVFRAQRFFPASGVTGEGAAAYSFEFDSCYAALKAYRERLPRLVELAKAMAIAALEAESDYVEARHDAFFSAFGENGLDVAERAQYPDYLVCVNADALPGIEGTRLTEMFSASLPAKVLVQTDDIAEPSPLGDGEVAFSLRSKQLASMAMALNDVFVLQSSSSNLFQFRERILEGLVYPGPALFSIFSGESGKASGVPPYLAAAAAMESRAFPAFTYDPSAGGDWASRYSLADNPQAELDWPVRTFAYEDESHQRVVEDVAFTLVDFLAIDPRYANHFARVPKEKWNGTLAPVGEYVARESGEPPDKVPCLLMVDGNNVLQKVVADDKLVREARRCREMWRSMQELGGIHNSHAEQLLARERKIWEDKLQREADIRVRETSSVPQAAVPVATASAAIPQAAPVAAPSQAESPQEKSDAPYIETPRCTSCDECTKLNNRMFAYDANKQATIVNPDAGTYRQLVEAAESCQVSIIHPGRPRNLDEPGLEELLKRAEPFL